MPACQLYTYCMQGQLECSFTVHTPPFQTHSIFTTITPVGGVGGVFLILNQVTKNDPLNRCDLQQQENVGLVWMLTNQLSPLHFSELHFLFRISSLATAERIFPAFFSGLRRGLLG